MSARIDGASWTSVTGALGASFTAGNPGLLVVIGADAAGTTLGFTALVTGPGVYPINAASGSLASLVIGAQAWQANILGGSGSIAVTTLTATGVSGTFTFTMVPVAGSGATGNKSITDGVFNMTC